MVWVVTWLVPIVVIAVLLDGKSFAVFLHSSTVDHPNEKNVILQILQKKEKNTAPILQGLSGLRRVETNSRVPGVRGKDGELLHVGGQTREDVFRGGGGVG